MTDQPAKPKQHRHSGKFYLELLALFFGGCVVAGVLLVWWLIQAPLQIDFAKGAVESAIARKTNLHPEIGHLALAWQGMGTPLEVQLSDVTVHNQQGDTIATFQAASLGLWLRPLLHGEIRPLSLTVVEPELTAVRQPDGSFNFGFGRGGGNKPFPQLLAEVFTPPANSALAAWEKLGIRQGHLVFLDEHAQPLGQVNGITLSLDRQSGGTEAELTGQAQIETTQVPISLKAYYKSQTGILNAHSELYDLPLSLLAGFDPALASLSGVAVPAAAIFDAAFDPGFQFSTAHLTVTLGEGVITLPDVFPAPVPVASGAIDLGYTANPAKIDLYGAGINLKGPTFDASAVATREDQTWHFDLTGAFKDIPIDQLANLWPKGAAPGGYAWITTNLAGGQIDGGTLHATGHAPQAAPDQVEIEDLKGGFKVTGTDVHYFGELPKVENVDGDISFDQNSLTTALTSGHIGDLKVVGGTVLIDGFNDPQQTIKIDVQQAGPVSTALDIVNHAPLYYAKKVKIDPAEVSGTATTQLHFDFPLLNDLPLAQINLLVSSDLQGVTLPHMIGLHAIENLTGALRVDTAKLTMTGTCILETMPVTVTVLRNFNHQNGLDSDVGFSGTSTDLSREKFGLAVPERLTGDVGVTGRYQDFGSAETVAMQLDLTAAAVKLSELAYVKPPGRAASGSLAIDLQQGAIHHIGDIRLKSKDLDIAGAADLNPDTGQLRRLALDRVQVGKTDAAAVITVRPDGNSKIAITGRVLDVEPLINEKHQEGETSATSQGQAATEVDVDLASLRTSAKSSVDSVQGTLQLLGRSWQSANFTAMAAGKKLLFAYQPDAVTGEEQLLLQTDDAGAFLAGFGLTDSVRGGQLKIEGQQPAKIQGTPRAPLAGHVDLENFRLVNTPILANMLSLLSLTGFMDSFKGQGIAFDALTGNFTAGNTLLTVSHGKLAGDALGLTIEGTGDRNAGTLDLHGIAVPFYSVNEFLNKIPLLGTMLTGGEGQGLFAANYSVKGTFDQPKVGINPLSVLTPGILRDLFFFRSNENPEAGGGG